MRTIKKVSIDEKLLLQFIGSLFELPQDAQVVEVIHTNLSGRLEVLIHSEDFPELIEGSEPLDYPYKNIKL